MGNQDKQFKSKAVVVVVAVYVDFVRNAISIQRSKTRTYVHISQSRIERIEASYGPTDAS